VTVSLFRRADIRDELSSLLRRPVELVQRNGLKPVIRDSLLTGEHIHTRPEIL
jgi:predicted nucleotidyltransferase